jgi:hypothetical protein
MPSIRRLRLRFVLTSTIPTSPNPARLAHNALPLALEVGGAGLFSEAVGAATFTASVSVVGPLGITVVGFTAQVRPGCKVLQVKVTVLLKPFTGVRVIVKDPVVPTITTPLPLAGLTANVKSGAAVVTCSVSGAETVPAEVAFPEYSASIVSVPVANAFVVNAATPAVFVTQPGVDPAFAAKSQTARTTPPSENWTVPLVGVGLTVAVKVTFVPEVTGDADVARVIVLAALGGT